MEREPNSEIQLPPGFRFHPSDEELIVHYLRNKVASTPLPASIITEIDLYKYNPWDLPKKALFGADEWYFFTPRERKYPNGVRPNRAAGSGYWKATGTDKPILTSCGTKSFGGKKGLVFYKGRPPKGVKTDWIMHEYRLHDSIIWTAKRKGSMRLDDWVLCRVRQKSGITRNPREDRNVSSYKPAVCYQQVEEPWSIKANPNLFAAVRNYFPMLPYLFASQDICPCIDTSTTTTRTSVQSSKIIGMSCSSAYEDNTNINDSQLIASPFNSFLEPQKGKLMEENQDIFLPTTSKKPRNRENEKEELRVSESNNISGVKFYGTNQQCQESNFDADQWSSLNQYQALDHLVFTESD